MNNMNQMNGNGFNPQQQSSNKFFLNFQPNDILQKEFKTKMRGYDQAEVDQFLDGIIKDYESYSNELNRLKAENNRLQQQLNSMPQNNQPNNQQNNGNQNSRQRMNRTIPVQPKAAPMNNFNATNKAKPDASTYDILRRISNLEKHVFGHDFANGVPNNSASANKSNEPIKQFASAAVPNNNNNLNNNNQANPFESGHNEINPDSMQQNLNNNNNMNNPSNNSNLSPNHFDANRQDMNGFGQNLNNNGNMSQF